MSVVNAKLNSSNERLQMRDTQNIVRILTNGSEAFDIIATPEQMAETIAYAENLYYKSKIETFWVNGVQFEEPTE
jgi:hypothetical protein